MSPFFNEGLPKDFRQFIRSICGLVFVPLERLEEAVELLEGVTFKETSRFYASIVAFKAQILDYFNRVWMK